MICLFYRGLCRYVIFIVLMFFSCAEDRVPITDTPLVYTIATASSVGGGITPSQTIEKGKTVSITALPNEHYQFKAWDSNCGQFNDQEATIRFEVTEHCLITAVFEKIYYKMTATAGEGGSIQGLSTNGYPQGQAITLTAIPEEHYVFSQWDIEAAPSHACPSISNPQTPIIRFIVQGPCGLKATFLKVPRTITTSVSQGGQITPPQTVEHGQAVSITVGLEEDYTFKAWSGTCGEFNPLETTITFTATKDCEISAILEQKTYTITALASEGGSIRGFTEREMIKGQTVSFMAVADQHHEFAQWRADESSDCPDLLEPMKATISFEVIGNCVLEAVFLKASRTIITSVSQGGQITPPQTVEHGQAVSITVGLEEDYTFKAWSGTCGEFNPLETTITFTATKDCEISAILEQKTYTITALASEGGSIRGFTEREMIKGQTVSFMAVADQHHEFAQWRADESSDCPDLLEPMKATISFEVIGNCVLEAVFLKASRTIITSVSQGGQITPPQTVEHGQAVSITVGLEEDYTFKAWSGTCGEFNPLETTITFTATKDCEISAF